MLYPNASKSVAKPYPGLSEPESRIPGPTLVRTRAPQTPPVRLSQAALAELALITSRRCSSFFAEAAVLVLVFGILDLFLLKGHVDLAWILGALVISLLLLAASIAMDFSAQRWIKAHP